MQNFVPLHVHDYYSQLDGAPSPEEYMARVKELDMTHLAQTNHGVTSGHRHFQRAAEAAGITPILGCLMPGQEIHTQEGVKKVEDIREGDLVLTHKGRFRKVLSTMKRLHTGLVYDINLARRGSRIVTVTDEHPLLISSFGEIDWVRADQIVSGRNKNFNWREDERSNAWNSYALMPKTYSDKDVYMYPVPGKKIGPKGQTVEYQVVGDDFVSIAPLSGSKRWDGWGKPLLVTERLARFLGLYMAEGSVYKDGRGQVTFTFGINETEYVNFIVGILGELGILAKVYTRQKKSISEVVFCHQPLSRMLGKYIGIGAKNKTVPEFIFNSREGVIKSFLSGVADGDARIITKDSGSRSIYLKLSSANGVWGVRALLANIGSFAEVKKVVGTTPAGESLEYYSVSWTEDAQFLRSQNFEDYVGVGIRTCTEREYSGYVYNFEVQEDNSYVSDFILHNCEIYHTDDMHDRRTAAKRDDNTQVYNHLTVLAKDQNGLNNLNHINKLAWQEGFYHKPRVGKDLLFENRQGLIALSGCMSGMVAKAILNDDMDRAVSIAQEHKDMLGDDYYIEVMATNPAPLNRALLQVADRLKIKAVMTSDCHYARKEDLVLEEALLILSTSPKPNFNADLSKAQKMDWLDRFNYLYPDRRMTFQEIEVYLRDYATERELFAKQGIDRDDIFKHTWDIAEKIGGYDYYKGLDMLPRPKGDPQAKLRKACEEGLVKRGVNTPEYRKRLDEELQVIFDKGFETYFLIMSRMKKWAEENDIMSGPGRGSSSAFLVNYALYLTHVDPIKYNLPAFRFLDPARGGKRYEYSPDLDNFVE